MPRRAAPANWTELPDEELLDLRLSDLPLTLAGTVIEARATELREELAARGHGVTLVCRPGAWIEHELRGGPVDVVLSDLHRWPTDELRRVAALVDARAIDVVHTHMSRAHFFGVLLRWFSDVPVVATAHNRRIQPHWMFNDGVIAVCEVSSNSLMGPVLAADVDIYADDVSYAPNPLNTGKDSLSFGMRFDAANAQVLVDLIFADSFE